MLRSLQKIQNEEEFSQDTHEQDQVSTGSTINVPYSKKSKHLSKQSVTKRFIGIFKKTFFFGITVYFFYETDLLSSTCSETKVDQALEILDSIALECEEMMNNNSQQRQQYNPGTYQQSFTGSQTSIAYSNRSAPMRRGSSASRNSSATRVPMNSRQSSGSTNIQVVQNPNIGSSIASRSNSGPFKRGNSAGSGTFGGFSTEWFFLNLVNLHEGDF